MNFFGSNGARLSLGLGGQEPPRFRLNRSLLSLICSLHKSPCLEPAPSNCTLANNSICATFFSRKIASEKTTNESPLVPSILNTGTKARQPTERQLKAARDYCGRNGLELDEGLSIADEGLSAYKGHNIERGSLGRFLIEVESREDPERYGTDNRELGQTKPRGYRQDY